YVVSGIVKAAQRRDRTFAPADTHGAVDLRERAKFKERTRPAVPRRKQVPRLGERVGKADVDEPALVNDRAQVAFAGKRRQHIVLERAWRLCDVRQHAFAREDVDARVDETGPAGALLAECADPIARAFDATIAAGVGHFERRDSTG